jgi:hypothetical protein
MAKFEQLLIGTILILTFISLINVNSSPTDITPVVVTSTVEIVAVNKNRECFTDGDCNGHGQCSNESICVCDRGWRKDINSADTKYCAYKQRSKKTAFLLSFFTGAFGVDWFYLSHGDFGYITAGILKLLLSCGCCCAWPLTYFGPEIQNSESVKAKLRGVSTCFTLLAFAWWIVDWARILGNRFPDGRGVSLTTW